MATQIIQIQYKKQTKNNNMWVLEVPRLPPQFAGHPNLNHPEFVMVD